MPRADDKINLVPAAAVSVGVRETQRHLSALICENVSVLLAVAPLWSARIASKRKSAPDAAATTPVASSVTQTSPASYGRSRKHPQLEVIDPEQRRRCSAVEELREYAKLARPLPSTRRLKLVDALGRALRSCARLVRRRGDHLHRLHRHQDYLARSLLKPDVVRPRLLAAPTSPSQTIYKGG